jgi:uncharacterized repeat protein (TIGR03803 family)
MIRRKLHLLAQLDFYLSGDTLMKLPTSLSLSKYCRLDLLSNLSFLLATLIGLALTAVQPMFAQTESVLHSFNGKDGSLPGPRLTLDGAGNLYGTTVGEYPSIGSVFKLTPTGQLKDLYKFTDGQNRLFTTGKLVLDREGNLYGVDQTGGTFGNGSIFRLTQTGVFTVLYSFTGQPDGAFPNGVIADATGNFYGTTNFGGAFNKGTVFKFTPGGSETVVYSFTGGSDGGEPFDAALYRDGQGNLFGTTMFDGGTISNGVVFKVTPEGIESVLHTFLGGSDGAHPKGSLIGDAHGNLYGATSSGRGLSGGTVFEITREGMKTELHTFSGTDGYDPNAGLAMDAESNLYGTTFSGGSSNDGVVFEISSEGVESVLHNFSGSDGSTPYSGVILNPRGNLDGTTGFGGADNLGTVFHVTP